MATSSSTPSLKRFSFVFSSFMVSLQVFLGRFWAERRNFQVWTGSCFHLPVLSTSEGTFGEMWHELDAPRRLSLPSSFLHHLLKASKKVPQKVVNFLISKVLPGGDVSIIVRTDEQIWVLGLLFDKWVWFYQGWSNFRVLSGFLFFVLHSRLVLDWVIAKEPFFFPPLCKCFPLLSSACKRFHGRFVQPFIFVYSSLVSLHPSSRTPSMLPTRYSY